MKISANQFGLINHMLQIGNDGGIRQFPLSELVVASDIFNEIKKSTKDDVFVDGDATFSTEQKTFILKLIDERKFQVADASTVFALKELLK